MINSYHNSTNLFGEKLTEYTNKAITQDKAVIEILTEAGTHLTAPEVHALFITRYPLKRNTPLTSIRRSLSTLYNNDVLEMVDVEKQGIFGRKNKQYRII
jgi:Fe2+ or Zn2+ uptake regulation protein